MRRATLLAVAAVLALPAPAAAQAFSKVPTATGKGGAAATVDALATRAAIKTLRKGGNAVDAAVAAAGVLGVVEPFSCGIGGGGFMVIRDGDTGRIRTLDHRERAPAAMRPDSFMENGEPLDFEDARYSGLSAGVPGTPLAWARALRRHGTMPLRKVLRPGERIARRGFIVDQTFHDQTEPNVPWFDDIPSTEEIYLDPDGTPRDVGTRLRNPDLAQTYRLLMRKGARRGFYRGQLAGTMAAAVQRPPTAPDADHRWRPGLMTADDVREYTTRWRRPTRVGYRGYSVWGMKPPSSGGSTVGEALNILEGYADMGASRTEAVHRFLEASRYAFADRNAYIADPSFVFVPLRGLLSDAFAAERRALIGPTASVSPVPAGDPSQEQAAASSADVSHPRQSTTHLTVADRDGNVVSYTFTIESTGGNGIVVPGYGFLLNNELTDFNFDDTDHVNRADGGKRPRSSMAPTIVTRNGRVRLALGSPGGSTIITTVLQILVERLDLGRTLPEAIAAPRAAQRNTASTQAEQAFIESPEGAQLAARGHVFATPPDPGEIGAATGIQFKRNRRFIAAAEPTRRGGGSAAVVRPE
jgi:gamma-glutamyltranspeptidase/glutathione hydrolase